MRSRRNNDIGWKVFSVVVALSLLTAAFFLFMSNGRILAKAIDSFKYRQTTKASLQALEERRDQLEDRVSRLTTDEGIDREIRERFPVSKSGEEVIMIVGEGNTEVTESAIGKASLWEKFLDWWNAQ